ncbi:prolipoprotein diacylglyceryl transferase [Nonomuraea sp. NPDC046570]|uniref:prolipoprotein diacylglyceryl transferase n=1 Tax=Nonomuraea sp. NPDC046570 TaxID=3155255 RepID=UPI0033E69F41
MPLASIPSPSEGVWYLGPLPLRAYALCIVLGVVVAVWLSERRWRARGGTPGTMIDIAVPAVVFGLIGGRLYHVITDWQLYFGDRAPNEPYEALFIWNGGLGIWGAVALGGVGVWLACRKRGLSLSAVADTVAPGIALAQAIGRWGNWFNQELYGGPTTLPWGLEIDIQHGGEPGVLYHPTFLYESIWNLALAFVLLWAGKRFTLRHGRLFMLYVAGYTLGRFWIEGLRIDPVGGVDHAVTLLGLRINQWTSIVLFVGALALFWLSRNKTGEEIVVSPDAEPVDAAGADPDPAHPDDQSDDEPEKRADPPGEGSEKGPEAVAEDDPADTPKAVAEDDPAGTPKAVSKDDPESGGATAADETVERTEDDAERSEGEAQAVREEEKNSR